MDRDVYETPAFRYLGSLPDLTRDALGSALHFAQVPIGSMPTPTPTPVETVNPTPTPTPVDTPTPTPTGTATPIPTNAPTVAPIATTETLGDTETGGSATPVPGSNGPSSGSGGGNPNTPQVFGSGGSGGAPTGTPGGNGGKLPFTGSPVAPLAALGAGLASVGAALRRAVRRH